MNDHVALATQRKQLIAEGRFGEARDVAQKMLADRPSDPALHNQMAWSLAALRDFAGAIQHQEKAIELAPRNSAYRLALAKYLEGRAEQQRTLSQQLAAADAVSFEEIQQVEKNAQLKMCQEVLEQCLDGWPYRVDMENKLRNRWVLLEHPLDSVDGWAKYLPEKFKSGEVAEILGIGSFVVLNPAETIQKRLSRGMPWELPIAVLLMELVSRTDPNSLVVEVGANIGTMTVPLSLNFAGKVLAFEPVARTAADLEANLKLNEIDNVILELKACGAQAGRGEMVRLLEENRGMAQLNVTSSGATIVTTIDAEAAARGNKISLIKIDVEGHEMAVLEGAQNVLRTHRPLVVCELLQKNVQPATALMKAEGYAAKRVFRSDWLFYPAAQ
jgi:FkbM family methyltransferase